MHIISTQFAGTFIVDIEKRADPRGFFARTFCEHEFATAGVAVRMVQSNTSWNEKRGTLRGMHFQWAPSREGKLVRCTRGSLLDVQIDLRPEEATFTRSQSVQLDAQSRRAVYIPPGVAHGFQTLEDDTEVLYQMTDFYAPELSDGVRWNDPAFAIEWPITPPIVSERDERYADFDARRFMKGRGDETARS